MAKQKVAVLQVGDRYMSDYNSLVVPMDESKEFFRKAGFSDQELDYIPNQARHFIAKNHPEHEAKIREGRIRIEPIQVRKWSKGDGQDFYEIDYSLDRLERPEEEYVVDKPETTMPKSDVRRTSAFRDLLGSMRLNTHDPIYIFSETRPGNLRRVVLDILAEMIRQIAISARIVRGKQSARFRQSIKELSELCGIPEPEVEKRIETEASALVQRRSEDELVAVRWMQEEGIAPAGARAGAS